MKLRFPLISISLLFSVLSYGQSSGILSSSRSNDWRHAGLPAIYPDNETTPNAWTPPTRSVCQTLSPGVTTAQINTAISSCSASHGVVLLNAGTYNLSGTINLANYVTLRGAGASKTTISGASIATGSTSFGNASLLTGNITQGSRTLTIANGQTAFPGAGRLAIMSQCDSGTTSATAGFMIYGGGGFNDNCAGSISDPALTRSTATLWVCAGQRECSASDGGMTDPHAMSQVFWVSGVSGSTITIDPSSMIEAPNWSTSRSAAVGWLGGASMVGAGVEDFTLLNKVAINGCYGCWMKGVRTITASGEIDLTAGVAHTLIANNYFGGSNGQVIIVLGGPASDAYKTDSDGLFLNNILDGTYIEEDGADHGLVLAYNYIRSTGFSFLVNLDFSHNQDNQMLMLREGNIQGSSQDDDTHSAHNLNTFFRNWLSGYDFGSGVTGNAVNVGGWARFENVIGNVIGSPNNATSSYGGNSGILRVNYDNPGTNNCNGGAAGPCDHTGLTDNSLMRWGNYVFCSGNASHCNVAGGTWDTAEVPTTSGSLSGWSAAVQAYANPVPASHNLPPSFFLSIDRTNYMQAHPSGGTGLSWWKTCSSWTSFPTTCASYSTPPMPPIGPDVPTISPGGQHANGYVWSIPAYIAYASLPADGNYAGLKQFDERVYGNDSGSGTSSSPVPPSGLSAVVQ
jgi:Pectate lyase superfamily protein